MGRLTSFVLGLFPALQQEIIDGQINKTLCRMYYDEILRLRNKLDNEEPMLAESESPILWTTHREDINDSTSDAWPDEPFRKSKRQQCKELEEVYLKQIEEDKADVPTEEDMSKFYG